MRIFAAVIAATLATQVGAQDLIAPKGAPGKYTGPHRPITRWVELKAKHAGHADWTELIVDDDRLYAEYISAKPGSKSPRSVHPDTRTGSSQNDGRRRRARLIRPPSNSGHA